MLLSSLLFIGNLGTGEIIALLVIVLLLFGAKRIPDLARGLGRGIREFKDATKEIKNDIENASNDDRYSNNQNRNNYNNGPGYNQPGNGYNNNNYNNGNAPYNNAPNANPNPTTPNNPNV
ncbi:Sec-independent protein translocase subunit TatA/TatB [Rufibacter psychrotolerans]|uniref:Sec-independent protein translocase subunit TatA/TatB n=1 Tax=Rufibacter psychrotolerans TaxID=2812556 RepID=UPI0019681508|nr:twin-arginine translocase TatA/TatE family subunit [Rufibacter sp. SYSU D00308]